MTDFSTLITKWYRPNQRKLPWRETNDPYKIWLSEVILQQTRVDQGTDYYLKFITAYPNVKALARASEDEVLRLWQGLGYYSRARNMHFAAKAIIKEHKGIFPSNYAEIRALKGVGPYTAAAVASIAYGLPHAVVDGNVIRVISRLFRIIEPFDTSKGKKQIDIAASEILDKANSGTHNQAMMELGSLICFPKKPLCLQCPVSAKCLAFADGSQESYPVRAKKAKVKQRYIHYLVKTDGKRVILRKRPAGDIWQGLYDFPSKELTSESKKFPAKVLPKGLKPKFDLELIHLLTHQKLQARFWLIYEKKTIIRRGEKAVLISNLDSYPMPQLLIRYLSNSPYFRAKYLPLNEGSRQHGRKRK